MCWKICLMAEIDRLADEISIKKDVYLTRTSTDAGAIFNVGDPDRLMTGILLFLEMTSSMVIHQGTIIRGKSSWGRWQWNEIMAQVLLKSEIGPNIITLEANSHETSVVLNDPEVVRVLFASKTRLRTFLKK